MFRICAILWLALPVSALADDFGDAGKRFAIDLLLVRGRGELRGLCVGQTKTEVSFAVRRDWMTARHPKWLGTLDARLADGRQEAIDNRDRRITEWTRRLETRANPNRQLIATIAFARVEMVKPEPQARPEDFLLVTVPVDQVRRLIVQPPDKRQLALVGWDRKEPKIEDTPAPALEKKIAKAVPDWREVRTNIESTFPAAPDDDRQWAARTAIWEFQFGEQVTFQGTGDSVFRTDRSDQRPALAEILPGLLQGGVARELEGLLTGRPETPPVGRGGEPKWLASARKQAEGAGTRGFRVTRVDLSTDQNLVSVDSAFLVRLPDGSWMPIWTLRHSERSDTPRAAEEAQIRRDPQLADVMKVADSLGAGGRFDQALRVGANTMLAQQAVDRRFREWAESMTKRLDGPGLTIPDGP